MPMTQVSPRSRKTALILASIPFTGLFGIDRFYLGYTVLGILKCLSCGGYFIWWIVDIIGIARGTLADKKGRPLRGVDIDAWTARIEKKNAYDSVRVASRSTEATVPLKRSKKRAIISISILIPVVAALVAGLVVGITSPSFEWNTAKDGEVVITKYVRSETSVIVPQEIKGVSVTRIGDRAFSGCTSLETIVIPDSVTSIGDSAFSGCTNLKTIVIPDSVTSIGSGVFSGCTNLKTIVIPDSVTSIGSRAFSGCTSLETIVIPDSVTSIGSSAFSGCTNLKTIVMPDSVTSIGSGAFSGCTGLDTIVMPDGVTYIGRSAFENTAWFDTWDNGVIYAGKIAYEYKGDKSTATVIEILEGTKIIGESLFYGCSNLASIAIPDSVTEIRENAFGNCTSLTNITLPDSLTSIQKKAFYNCTGLERITIPYNVTSVYRDNFVFQTNAITGRNESLSKASWDSAFSGCVNLTNAVAYGRTYSALIIGYWNDSARTPVYDLPKAFYDAIN